MTVDERKEIADQPGYRRGHVIVIAYVAGPYNAPSPEGITHNIADAEKVARALWAAGVTTICPHLNTRHFGDVAPDRVFLGGYIEILKRCDVLVMLPGWESSRGASVEYYIAQERGMTIIQIPNWETLDRTIGVIKQSWGSGRASRG